jgi:hypothetical protein
MKSSTSSFEKNKGQPPSDIKPLPPIVRCRAVPQTKKVVRAQPTKDSWELLVQWVGRSAADATWLSIADFKTDYPAFQLEDELFH